MATVYAPMEGALFVARGSGGGGWQTRTCLTDRSPECVAASPDRPERVLVGTFDAGLQRSVDGGETFERVGVDALPERVMSLSLAPDDPDELWVGTEPSRVFRSVDGGDTWTERTGLADLPSADEWYFPPRPDTHHVRWIERDPTERQRLYVGVEAGAFVYSTDGGETWHDRPPGSRRDNHSLAVHPDAPGRVYSAAGDGYAESTDGGASWTELMEGLDHRYCWSVAVDPADPDTRVLSAASGARRAHWAESAESYLYRRTADEDSWTRLDAGVPTGEGVLRAVLDAPAPGAFYAVSNRGLFRSADAGQSWTVLDVEWPDAFREQTARGLAVVGV